MPYSDLTLLALADAVGHLATSEAPLIERLQFADNKWLSSIYLTELDADLRKELNACRKVINYSVDPRAWQQVPHTLVTILVRFAVRQSAAKVHNTK
jgi:hypothetical protein